MADLPPSSGPAPGWWQASDGNWYPPEQQPGYGAQPYGGQVGYGYQVQPSRGTNGWAIASLVVSIVSCGFGSILGVIFGHVAMSQINRNGDQGRGLAVAGLVIGYIGLAVTIVAIVALVAVAENDFSDLDGFEGLVG